MQTSLFTVRIEYSAASYNSAFIVQRIDSIRRLGSMEVCAQLRKMPKVRGGMQAARRLRGKQKPEQEEKVKCCAHWENEPFNNFTCGHGTCGPCIVGSLKATCEHWNIYFSCSQCRRMIRTENEPLKFLFAEFVPSHSKTVDACCGKRFVVAHLPCEFGCYDCIDSKIRGLEM